MILTIALAVALGIASPPSVDSRRWLGRTVYFVVTDRFAADGEVPPCTGKRWCGGTLDGVRSKLDYIQASGFDAVWITPVVQQVEWRDNFNGTGYHGYCSQMSGRTSDHPLHRVLDRCML